MKNDRLIDLGLTGYEELFMSTEERLDAKKPKVEAIPLAALTPFRNHPFNNDPLGWTAHMNSLQAQAAELAMPIVTSL